MPAKPRRAHGAANERALRPAAEEGERERAPVPFTRMVSSPAEQVIEDRCSRAKSTTTASLTSNPMTSKEMRSMAATSKHPASELHHQAAAHHAAAAHHHLEAAHHHEVGDHEAAKKHPEAEQ